jgi:hypothetical protein
MAKIRVSRREADGDYFPRLCMRCGQPADCDVPQKFAWMPSWVMILILVGLAPWLIVALLTRKTMRVVAPMCTRHAGHWRVRKLYVWLGLFFWIAYGVALVAFSDHIPKDAMAYFVMGGFGGLLVWLVSAAILSNGAIRPSEIRDRGMDLINVHKDFADAWYEGDY